MNYFWPRSVNTHWGPGPANTNWGPGLVNTNLVPRPVNTSWGPGQVIQIWGQGQGRGPSKGQRARKYKYPNMTKHYFSTLLSVILRLFVQNKSRE